MNEDAILQVKVVPGASRDEVAGLYGDGIKLRVSTPAQKGMANQRACEILAQWLQWPQSQIELISGATQPRKRFRIAGLSQTMLQAKMQSLQ